ncbi:hypothetical protein [Methylobacterium sp.]|uniref:hypothetical protein n=1 Tax=Methylobacterium sp. TaxID=409 RepID=UPI0025F115C1|nr:hypothetical protein [Methylobacterium sp.]MBY0256997.1 hypothetical protein [Methylobacterium sp.]
MPSIRRLQDPKEPTVVGKPQSSIAPLSAAEFRARLRELGRTQDGFAQEIGSSLRSVNRWSNEGPPPAVAYLLDLLETLELHVGASQMELAPKPLDLAVRDELDRVLARATALGRRTETLKDVRTWLAEVADKEDRPAGRLSIED